MPKTIKLHNNDGSLAGWMTYCPGCQQNHLFDQRWTFNGDEERPTFTPSMHIPGRKDKFICHSHTTDGKVQFLGDCTHELRGQTVDLEEID